MMDGLFELERTTGPQVFNKRHKNVPTDAVYIGRGSPYGNPFVIGDLDPEDNTSMTRERVIALYQEYFLKNEKLQAKAQEELRGKDLVCYCKPAACHGDFLLSYVNG